MAKEKIGKRRTIARMSRPRVDLPKHIPEDPYFERPVIKFTRIVIETILGSIASGDPPIVACRRAGVDSRTLRSWIDHAKNGDPKYTNFLEDMRKSEAEAEHRRLALVELAARGGKIPRYETDPKTGERKVVGYDTPDGASARWLLERGPSSKRRWAPLERREVTGKGGTPFFGALNFGGWTNEELERFAAAGVRPGGERVADPGSVQSIADDLEDALGSG